MNTELILKNENGISQYLTADEEETIMLEKAAGLMRFDFPDHALLELWNASVHNLRRRIEMYSIDIFISTISSFAGRKNYKKDGDTLSERWAGVDDANLINGAIQIGVLNKKAGQALDMINWMRNHASPAHDSDDSVTKEDVIGLAILLQNNLFNLPIPDPVHSPVALLDPIKSQVLTENQIELFKEEINGFSNKDIRTIFGYSMDVITSGEQPAYDNISLLFGNVWDKATEELRTNYGLRIHNYMFDPTQDKSSDNSASERLYAILLKVSGIKYIPDSTRANIYRKLAKNLATAKNTSYGWSLENSASRALKQVGVHVPSIAFEDVYQEILSVWCGNYWGRSEAHIILKDFIFALPAKQQVMVAKLFQTNERVRDELYQVRPKNYANARFHVGNNRRNLYKIDLTAFFPSITRDTVYCFFAEDLLCSPDVAQLLTDLTTIDLEKSSAKNIDEIYDFLKGKNVSSYNHLISGAPTSQILSYLVNHQMFDEMQKLADDNGITMTVYVDDVTFSSENRISKDFRDKIIAIIRKYNYQISRKKVKRYTKLYPKLVTGVIIDATGKTVLKNSMRQKIILAYDDLKANPENADVRMRLKGLLIAARQVNKDAFPTIYKFAFQQNESNDS